MESALDRDEELPMVRSLSSSSLSSGSEGRKSVSHDEWRRRTWAQFVLSLLRSKNGMANQCKEKERRRRVLTVAAIAAVLLVWLRRRRKGGVLQSILPAVLSSVTSSQSLNEYSGRHAKEASLSLLWTAAKKGRVLRARLLDSAVAFQIQDGSWRRATVPKENPSFQSTLLEALAQGGCVDIATVPESLWSRLATPAIAALPFVYLALLYKMMRNLHGNVDSVRTHGRDDSGEVTFQDVAGLDSVVTEVSEVVSYLDNPIAYHGLGARAPRGILLYGPPGSGKTLLARAVAGEAQCEVFMACSGSDFVESYVGRGAARIRSLFDKARSQARGNVKTGWLDFNWRSPHKPLTLTPGGRKPSAIVFMDEIDAIAKSRSGVGGLAGNEERDQTLNQLLTEIDGFASNEGVTLIFIAATNRPDVLDPAILRRFDRRVHVGYPDEEGRHAILEIHVQNIHHGHCLDLGQLASDEMTYGFSGADLRNVVNEAALLAVREQCLVVQQSHLLHAARRVKQMKTSVKQSDVGALLANLPPILR